MSHPIGEAHQFSEQSPTFQEAADLAYTLVQTDANQLGLQPFGIEGHGIVVPVASYLMADGPPSPSHLTVSDKKVHHQRDYPLMTASSLLVGLWPHGNQNEGEAALYRAEAAFQPQSTQLSMPLTHAVLEASGRDKAKIVSAPQLGDGTIIVQDGSTNCHFLPQAETRVRTEESDHDEYGANGALRAVMHGRMTITRLPDLFRVSGDIIYGIDPQGEGYQAYVPEKDPVLTDPIPVVPLYKPSYGNYVHVDEHGNVVPVHQLRAFPLPRLPLVRAVELATGPVLWKDASSLFLEEGSFARTIKNVLRLGDAGLQLAQLHGQATDVLAEARTKQPLQPDIIGSSMVLAQLRSMSETARRGSNVVTRQWLER